MFYGLQLFKVLEAAWPAQHQGRNEPIHFVCLQGAEPFPGRLEQVVEI